MIPPAIDRDSHDSLFTGYTFARGKNCKLKRSANFGGFPCGARTFKNSRIHFLQNEFLKVRAPAAAAGKRAASCAAGDAAAISRLDLL